MSRRSALTILFALLLLTPLTSRAQVEPPPIKVGSIDEGGRPGVPIEPMAVAVAPLGEVYVLDRRGPTVRKHESDGTVLLEFGGPGSGPGEFAAPEGIAVDPATGNIFVADTGNFRVQEFSPDGVYLSEFTIPFGNVPKGVHVDNGIVWAATDGGYVQGYYPSTGLLYGRIGVEATEPGNFDISNDMAIDSAGNFYVATQYVGVQKFDTNGVWRGEMPVSAFNHAFAVACDDHDNVYVGTDNGVWKFDSDWNELSAFGTLDTRGLAIFEYGTIYVAPPDAGELEIWGYAPVLTSVADVTSDQGRWVRLTWNRSELDRLIEPWLVTGYGVYRRLDAKAAFPADLRRAAPEAGKSLGGWDVIAMVPARGDDTYQLVAPTLADSTGTGGIAWSVFVVSAYSEEGSFWDSPPDSGYSVDNLPPPVPSAPMVVEDPGQFELELNWQASPAPDLGHYAVYRGATSGFLPLTPLDSHATTVAPYYTDDAVASGETWYYRVGVFDDAETFSGYSASAGSHVVASAGAPDLFTPGLAPNVPNPFNPQTELRFNLPVDGQVRLTVYDVGGRTVRRLFDGRLPAGPHQVVWDGRDDSGLDLASGVYFYRLRSRNLDETRKMVLNR